MPDAATLRDAPENPPILSHALAMARRKAGSLALLGVASRLVGSFAIGPAVSVAVAFLVARKGRYSFGNDEILEFALSPTGVLTLVLAATLILFAQTAEVAALLLLGREPEGKVESRFVRSAWGAFAAAPRLLDLAGRQCLVLAALAAPFLAAIGATYWSVWSGSDLNYLVEVRPPRFWIGAAIAAILAGVYGGLAFLLLVRWAFAIPSVLFERRWGLAALRRSTEGVRGLRWRIARTALGWGAATLAAHALTVAILSGFSRLVLARTDDSLAVALPIAAALLALHALALSAVGFAANAVGAFLLLALYEGPRSPAARADLPRLSWLPSRASVLVTSASLAIVAVFFSFGLMASLHVRDAIAITGHRGDVHDSPENTVAAFLQAIEAGADYGELDVQLSKDGYVVVAHDADLLRLVGLNRKIRDMTLAELRAVDLGSAFSPKFRGEHVPLLAEIIDAVGDRLKILIEIKVYPGDDTPSLVRKTVDLIREKRFSDRCIVISLSYEALQAVREIDPSLKLGYLVSGSVGDLTRLDVDALLMRAPLVTSSLVAAARRRGKAVHAWTVDNPDILVRAWDRGAVNVITNDPRRLIAARNEVESLGVAARLLLKVRDLLSN